MRKVAYTEFQMDVSSIPTSFVPRPTSATAKGGWNNMGAFAIFCYAIFILSFALLIGVFIYGRILSATFDAKETELANRVESIDTIAVESFVRLRNRLEYGADLLSNHTGVSSLFATIEKVLPTPVRLTSIRLTIGTGSDVRMESTGIAKSFNALATASAGFAQDGSIKDAIFSDIRVNKDNSVSFSLSARIDPDLVKFTP